MRTIQQHTTRKQNWGNWVNVRLVMVRFSEPLN